MLDFANQADELTHGKDGAEEFGAVDSARVGEQCVTTPQNETVHLPLQQGRIVRRAIEHPEPNLFIRLTVASDDATAAEILALPVAVVCATFMLGKGHLGFLLFVGLRHTHVSQHKYIIPYLHAKVNVLFSLLSLYKSSY